MELRGRRVVVMGLGRHGGGVAAARYAAFEGAHVTVTDTADGATLRPSIVQLTDVPIDRFVLGEHRAADLRSADVVIVNPAVPPGDPFLQEAASAGAWITSETELFLEACPAPMIGVTGSNGKSTTSAMIAAILEADGQRCWLGGNIGRSLLTDIGQIASSDWVVVELSSFQLARLRPGTRVPQVAVITGCAPNHLDWHASYAEYVAAKQRMLAWQTPDDVAVVNTRDAEVAGWLSHAAGHVEPLVAEDCIPRLAIAGEHNVQNAVCAATAALAVGRSLKSLERGLGSFRGLPHRLELVAEVAGRRLIDDSKATTPEAVAAALDSMDRPTWLVAGGKDKGAGFDLLADAVVRQARGACFYGAARDTLYESAQDRNRQASTDRIFAKTEKLEEAVLWCWERSRAGESILLSPACSSYDQFRDYAHRAERFVEIVHELGRGVLKHAS